MNTYPADAPTKPTPVRAPIHQPVLKVIGLGGGIGGIVIILAVFLEGRVAQIAPQNGGHTQLVSVGKSFAHFNNLTAGFRRTKIDGCANGHCTHVPGLLDIAKDILIDSQGQEKI